MVYTLRFFPSKCNLFHNSNVFGSYIIHILYTGVLKLRNNSGAKRLSTRKAHNKVRGQNTVGVLIKLRNEKRDLGLNFRLECWCPYSYFLFPKRLLPTSLLLNRYGWFVPRW